MLDASPERIRLLGIDAVLDEADPPIVGWFQFSIAPRVKQAADDGRKEDEALLALLHITVSMAIHEDEPKRPFRPAFVMNDGSRSALPEDFGDEHFEALAQVREVVANLELKARISDVLWQRKRRNPEDAKRAVDAYLACAEVPGMGWHDRYQRIKRAYQLALALGRGSPDSFASVEARLLKHIRVPEADSGYYAERLLRLLLRTERTADERSEFAGFAMGGGRRAIAEGDPNRAHAYFSTAAKWFDLLKKPEAAKEAQIAAAEATVANALSQPQALAQSSLLADAVKELRNAGAPAERIAEIRHDLDEAQRRGLSEMVTIQATTDLSEPVRLAKDAARGRSFDVALQTLALRFRVPPISSLREEALKLLERYPLSQGLGGRQLGPTGRVTGVAGPLIGSEGNEAALIARMREGANRYWQLAAAGIVEPFLEQMLLEHAPSIEDFIDLVAPKPFVPSGREHPFALGLRAGFYGEWYEAAHILVPQIENALRSLLESTGELVYGQHPSGIQDYMKLEQVLTHPKTATVLNEDVAFDLDGLLSNRLGANLRNRVSHGLLEWNAADRNHAIYLWWLVLHIMYQVRYIEAVSGPNETLPAT